jgi:hypothetical protein
LVAAQLILALQAVQVLVVALENQERLDKVMLVVMEMFMALVTIVMVAVEVLVL